MQNSCLPVNWAFTRPWEGPRWRKGDVGEEIKRLRNTAKRWKRRQQRQKLHTGDARAWLCPMAATAETALSPHRAPLGARCWAEPNAHVSPSLWQPRAGYCFLVYRWRKLITQIFQKNIILNTDKEKGEGRKRRRGNRALNSLK